MDWFQQLRAALPAYYPPGSPADVVGYLQGSGNPIPLRAEQTPDAVVIRETDIAAGAHIFQP